MFRKARFFWVYPLVFLLFATASISERSLRIGVILALLGEALRWWADGYVGHVKVNTTQHWRHDPKIGRLITAGPYAYVRHPLYFGTLLIGLGFCVAVRNLPLTLAALALFFFLYHRKAEREEQLILGEWGEAYAAYQRAVPRWWPIHPPYAERHGRWSWQGIRASKEWKTLLWVIIALLAVYFREEWSQEHELFSGDGRFKHVLLAAAAGLLILSDGVLELIVRRRAASSPP